MTPDPAGPELVGIACAVCGGEGYYCPGTVNYYDGSPDEVWCGACYGYGYLPLLGWAVLDSTYGSAVNSERRYLDALAQELAEAGGLL